MEWESVEQGKRKKKHGKRRGCLIAILAVVFIVVIAGVINSCPGDGSENLVWPKTGLATLLPEPPTDKGDVIVDSEEAFSASLDEVSAESVAAYMDACEEKGFTVDESRSSSEFSAYLESGEHLSLLHFDSGESLSIDVEAAVEMSALTWPTAGPGSQLPAPTSLMGHVDVDSSSQYAVTLGELSVEQFSTYVDACMAAGFNVDYTRGDDSFAADNASGAHVSVSWLGNSMMKVAVSAPDETETTEPAAEATTEEPAAPAQEQEPASVATDADGVSADFKATLDEYEAFFNEYVDFMNTYNSSSDNVVSMALDYADMMKRYSDYMSKLDAIDENSLSAAELAYFTEVQGRINQKLLSIGQ